MATDDCAPLVPAECPICSTAGPDLLDRLSAHRVSALSALARHNRAALHRPADEAPDFLAGFLSGTENGVALALALVEQEVNRNDHAG